MDHILFLWKLFFECLGFCLYLWKFRFLLKWSHYKFQSTIFRLCFNFIFFKASVDLSALFTVCVHEATCVPLSHQRGAWAVLPSVLQSQRLGSHSGLQSTARGWALGFTQSSGSFSWVFSPQCPPVPSVSQVSWSLPMSNDTWVEDNLLLKSQNFGFPGCMSTFWELHLLSGAKC